MTEKLIKTRYDASREDVAAILGDGPKYRLDQVWQGLYTEFQAPLEITTISKELRAKLDAARALQIPVILIDRPSQPERKVADEVAKVLQWLGHQADRGV